MLQTFTNQGWCVLKHVGEKCLSHVWWSPLFFLLSLFCISDLGPGHGGYGQHCERLAGEPGEVCPLSRRQPVTWSGALGWGPYSHRGGVPHLQLQVGQLSGSLIISTQALKFNLQTPWPLKLFTNLSLAPPPQATHWRLWQMFLHFHSLWGVQKEEKVTSSWSDFDRFHLTVSQGITGCNVTWLIMFPQYKDIHSPRPPWPVRRPRLAHVSETQERDGGQLWQNRYVKPSETKYQWSFMRLHLRIHIPNVKIKAPLTFKTNI